MRVRSGESLGERFDGPATYARRVRRGSPQARQVEEQSLAQRPRTADELTDAGPRQHMVYQHDRSRHEVRPLRIAAGELRPPDRIDGENSPPQPGDLRAAGACAVQAGDVIAAGG